MFLQELSQEGQPYQVPTKATMYCTSYIHLLHNHTQVAVPPSTAAAAAVQ
jgi:hypothetical protein